MSRCTLPILGLLLAACAESVTRPDFVVPPAAGPQSGLSRWDYYCYDASQARSAAELTAYNKRLGWEGWEFVGTIRQSACFKRPLAPGVMSTEVGGKPVPPPAE
jgi:hypothetical protein